MKGMPILEKGRKCRKVTFLHDRRTPSRPALDSNWLAKPDLAEDPDAALYELRETDRSW